MTATLAPRLPQPGMPISSSAMTSRETLDATKTNGNADGQCWSLGAVDWETYRKIADALTGRHVRLTYDRGRLEFMTISGKHGILSRLFNRLIGILTEELAMNVLSCGDMTCDREDAGRGLEPDECFYLENEPQVRGKDDIDLSVDPPPDRHYQQLNRQAPSLCQAWSL